MTVYFLVKYLHVLGAVVILGSGTVRMIDERVAGR